MAVSPNLDWRKTPVDEDEEQVYDRRILPKYLNNISSENERDQEKSLQELDLDYMSLKICNKYEEYQSSPDEEFLSNNNSHLLSIQEQQDDSPLFTFETLSSQISNESHLSFDSNADLEKSIDSTYQHLLKVGAKSNPGSRNIEHEFPATVSTQNSQRTANKMLDFNQFKYASKKRKLSDDESSNQSQRQPCKTQKGMTSKTVSKHDLMYKSPFGSQEMLPSRSSNRKEAKVFPFMVRKQDYYKSSKSNSGMISRMEGSMNCFEKYKLSQRSDFEAMSSIPLTPRSNRRLGFEKAPGLSGQTRLVFQ